MHTHRTQMAGEAGQLPAAWTGRVPGSVEHAMRCAATAGVALHSLRIGERGRQGGETAPTATATADGGGGGGKGCPAGEYGGFAVCDLEAGALVISVPNSMMATLLHCSRAMPEGHGRLAVFSGLALWLVRMLVERPAVRAPMAEAGIGPTHTAFQAFVDSLNGPTQLSNAPYMSAQTVEEHSRASADYGASIQSTLSRVRASGRYLADVFREQPERYPASTYTPARVTWAQAILCSRGMTVNGVSMLLPVVDMLNHAADGCVFTCNADGSLHVRTTRAYRAGDEVFLNYGADKGPAELLADYGVLLPVA